MDGGRINYGYGLSRVNICLSTRCVTGLRLSELRARHDSDQLVYLIPIVTDVAVVTMTACTVCVRYVPKP